MDLYYLQGLKVRSKTLVWHEPKDYLISNRSMVPEHSRTPSGKQATRSVRQESLKSQIGMVNL
ncbi:hypothetical protein [Nostoc sp. CHAB 5715]|uniref:hypothetical protein n=1 Tax=Nostoc sp. CHAB 5715 TaxID=2780400 RepID=UPI001E550113|nr:hypothetical protein [Nostoc sp. CHAB 5715]MCC5625527.1 hypothetical protein [Nostoc sp. CHAB 5715]